MKNNLTVFVLMTVIFISCSESKYNRETASLKTLITNLNNNTITGLDKKYYLIIPLEGCSSCIKSSIKFAQEHTSNEDITFIITHYDTKVIRSIFSNYASNIIIDNNFEAMGLGLVVGSPVLIKVLDGEITSIDHLDSNNIDGILSSLDI